VNLEILVESGGNSEVVSVIGTLDTEPEDCVERMRLAESVAVGELKPFDEEADDWVAI